MSERVVATLCYGALAIFCVAFFWYASALMIDAMPELQALQSLQINHLHRSN